MSGTLYVVGTPIGNLSDISERALETLSEVDFIAAEDTRVTLKLLTHFGIRKPMISYYEHNMREKSEIIIGRIAAGESCAIVTDAGMPCISDPGEDLVRLCHERGLDVRVIPGPSAVISALAISGQKTGRFCFEGFLSTAKKSRAEHLASVQKEQRTMIFYEGPHKLTTTLRDMLDAFGDRRLTIARELTKIHEQAWPTTLSEALRYYEENTPKGEFVLVIEGAPKEEEKPLTLEQAVERGRFLMKEEKKSASEAAKLAAAETGYKKGDLYQQMVQMR